ncbi:hypothetical protein DFH09DRAFT_1452625 [Mycena vulgaris]|nr:hypothetical protein DFH09DRAFT_1452625 [Mycena vulgaris]
MSTILRRAVSATRTVSCSRTFSSSAAARKDIVQDLYLKEIKAYKAPPTTRTSVWSRRTPCPPTPKAPALPTDLATELSAYDASEPVAATVEKAAPSESHHGELTGGGAEEFLELCEADVPEEGHH